MKCSKCDKEVDADSKFCSNCGERIKEKPLHVRFDESMETCAKTWYILGYIRGININDKKSLKEIDDKIKNCPADIGDLYQKIINYWRDRGKQDNEKNKKANGSKRASIPKTQRSKAKEE